VHAAGARPLRDRGALLAIVFALLAPLQMACWRFPYFSAPPRPEPGLAVEEFQRLLEAGDVDGARACLLVEDRGPQAEMELRSKIARWSRRAADGRRPAVLASRTSSDMAVVIINDASPGRAARPDVDPVFMVWLRARWLMLYNTRPGEQTSLLNADQHGRMQELARWYEAEKDTWMKKLSESAGDDAK
jgi:hypothetical protein